MSCRPEVNSQQALLTIAVQATQQAQARGRPGCCQPRVPGAAPSQQKGQGKLWGRRRRVRRRHVQHASVQWRQVCCRPCCLCSCLGSALSLPCCLHGVVARCRRSHRQPACCRLVPRLVEPWCWWRCCSRPQCVPQLHPRAACPPAWPPAPTPVAGTRLNLCRAILSCQVAMDGGSKRVARPENAFLIGEEPRPGWRHLRRP